MRDTGVKIFDTSGLDREARSALIALDARDRAPGESSPITRTNSSVIPSPGQIRDVVVPEVLKSVGILVREGGGGELRLVLKPDSLGNIRIRVQIENNSLEGKILVDNSIVRDIVESNLAGLKSALRAEGFEQTALEVAVSDDRSRRRSAGDQSDGQPVKGGVEYEQSIPEVAYIDQGSLHINLVV